MLAPINNVAAVVVSFSSIDFHIRRSVSVSAFSSRTFANTVSSAFAISISNARCSSVILSSSFLHFDIVCRDTLIFLATFASLFALHVSLALSSNLFIVFMSLAC